VTVTIIDIAVLAGVGFGAGVLGGLLGLGGSIIMIPAMTLLFAGGALDNQHLFQASAMIANVVISIPGALRHRKAGTVPHDVVRWFMPAMVVFMIVGVMLSNMLGTTQLRAIFAIFLVYVGLATMWKVVRRHPDHQEDASRTSPQRAVAVGAITGTTGGLLGIGGGVLAVPLLQMLCRIPLRRAIAASATVMVVSSVVGASLKTATLGPHGASWTSALLIAACMAPTAMLGGNIGAGLTHRAPIQTIRVVFGITVLVMASRMAGLW
jgi:uncharacterized protein